MVAAEAAMKFENRDLSLRIGVRFLPLAALRPMRVCMADARKTPPQMEMTRRREMTGNDWAWWLAWSRPGWREKVGKMLPWPWGAAGSLWCRE